MDADKDGSLKVLQKDVNHGTSAESTKVYVEGSNTKEGRYGITT